MVLAIGCAGVRAGGGEATMAAKVAGAGGGGGGLGVEREPGGSFTRGLGLGR